MFYLFIRTGTTSTISCKTSRNHNVKVIVVTDGNAFWVSATEGIGGMGILIGKLSLYTTCGGISPAYTLPDCSWTWGRTISSCSTIRCIWAGAIRVLPTMSITSLSMTLSESH